MNFLPRFVTPALVAVSFIFACAAQAQPQPMIKAAENHLSDALNHVVQSGSETPKKHLTNAIADLEVAKSKMDEARKNKGSHTHVAIEKIDLAEAEIQALQKGAGSRDKAMDLIKDAIKEVAEARRAGKR